MDVTAKVPRAWLWLGIAAVVGGCVAVASHLEQDEPSSDRADNLYACDESRRIWVQTIDPSLRSDPIFRYELASKPLTGITAQFTYDTGVINATGETDGAAA